MPIEPITNLRLYKKVADQLAHLIHTGEYQPGQKLPGERNLIERLGVSRSSLREALISLEIEGLIEIRDRSGVFVLGEGKTAVPEVMQSGNVLELFSARRLIEAEVAAMAARLAGPEHIEALMQLLGKMVVTSANDPEGVEYDRQFHLILAKASGNRVLLRTVEFLWGNTQRVIAGQFAANHHTESTWQAVVIEHRDIFNAIRKKDPQAAQAAMQQHLENAINRLIPSLH